MWQSGDFRDDKLQRGIYNLWTDKTDCFTTCAYARGNKNIGGFKFGSLVRDQHTYIHKYEILADLNLAVAKTTKPPKFLAIW